MNFGKSKAKLFAKGKQSTTFNDVAGVDDEFGYRPFSSANTGVLKAETECRLARFQQARFASLLSGTPQRNYLLRKFRVDRNDPAVDWLLGGVTIS